MLGLFSFSMRNSNVLEAASSRVKRQKCVWSGRRPEYGAVLQIVNENGRFQGAYLQNGTTDMMTTDMMTTDMITRDGING